MNSFRFGAEGDSDLQVVWDDGERVVCRRRCLGADGKRTTVLAVRPVAELPFPPSLLASPMNMN
jgi:hypothetical protein